MKKIQIQENQKEILNKLVRKLSEKTGRDYKLIFDDYMLSLKYEYKGTTIPVHSFIADEVIDPHLGMYFYLRGAIEN